MKPKTSSHILQPIRGEVFVPGDKSISHRALIIASQAIGTSNISGILLGEDVLHTASCLRQLGVVIDINNDKAQVQGVGIGGFKEPDNILDFGNSGTSVRLMMGLLATTGHNFFLTGDASLRTRPMQRVCKYLQIMGAKIISRENIRLPICIQGCDDVMQFDFITDTPSAQVKSALILAALGANGISTVAEQVPTRDHLERMLEYFDATIATVAGKTTIEGNKQFYAKDISVPGDPSSAAFVTALALLVPNSEITIRNVGINKHRIGFYQALQAMGADISFENQRDVCNEPVADIKVKHSQLSGINVNDYVEISSMIDEVPIFAALATQVNGKTVIGNLAELKVKESNRFNAIIENLIAIGATVETEENSITIVGDATKELSGKVKTYMDHRIAMSFITLGAISQNGITVDDTSFIDTSFPQFITTYQQLGANIT